MKEKVFDFKPDHFQPIGVSRGVCISVLLIIGGLTSKVFFILLTEDFKKGLVKVLIDS